MLDRIRSTARLHSLCHNNVDNVFFNSYKLRIECMLLKEELDSNLAYLEPSIEAIRCAARGNHHLQFINTRARIFERTSHSRLQTHCLNTHFSSRLLVISRGRAPTKREPTRNPLSHPRVWQLSQRGKSHR